MWILKFYLWPFGRITRLGLFVGGVIVPAILSAGALFFDLKSAGMNFFELSVWQADTKTPLLDVYSWISLWPLLCLGIKRFHDLNLSGWLYILFEAILWVLSLVGAATFGMEAWEFSYLPSTAIEFIKLVPHPIGFAVIALASLLSLLLLAVQLFVPGTPGENSYGADPIEMKA